MDTKHIKISEYNYPLPDERIAKFPLKERDKSKLLIYQQGNIKEDIFENIVDYLPKGSLLIYNNTKVIQARIHFRKPTGSQIEVFLLEPAFPADYEQVFQTTQQCSWFCMVGNLKKWKSGILSLNCCVKGQEITLVAEKNATDSKLIQVNFQWNSSAVSFAEILEAIGELPIPPYLNRSSEESDKITYQTVYSKIKGSVAAPTAGLHFTDEVFKKVDAKNITREEVTLHVGAGTFKPVKSEEIEGHDMHTEYICVHKNTLKALLQHKLQAIAVGTTSVRTLESLYFMGAKIKKNPNIEESELHVNQWEPYSETAPTISAQESIQQIIDYLERNNLNSLHSSTQIIIAPGYKYKIVNMLITNFHQPQSTLLLLVSAFVKGDWKKIYNYALDNQFRFLSYGDSSLLIP